MIVAIEIKWLGATLVEELHLDHGAMDGLGHDDHTQYLLADGTRDLTDHWTIATKNITLTGGTLTAEQITSTDDLNVTDLGTFGHAIVIGTLSVDAVAGEDTLVANFAGNHNVGIGIANATRKLEIRKDGTQLKLSYGDAYYVEFDVQSDGDIDISSSKTHYNIDFGAAVLANFTLRSLNVVCHEGEVVCHEGEVVFA